MDTSVVKMSKRELIEEGVNEFGWRIKFEKILPGKELAGSGTRMVEHPLLSVSWTQPSDGHSTTWGQRYHMTDYDIAKNRFDILINHK